MGWFDGLFGQSGGSSAGSGGGSASSSSSDPLAKLDPKLREFLQKESPLKYKQATEQQPEPPQKDDRPPIAPQPTPSATDAATGEPGVPPESLYQDGRYAHLWKTYRPLAAVEAATKSDHERMMDVLDAYNDRRSEIGRAALENCALEQIDWNECMKTGPLTSRMTMCHAEMKKFERCYNMQSRLLKALGYLSAYDRPADVDERIQVHADTLYHRMLEQEAAAELAKAEGRPVPAAKPVDFSATTPSTPSPATTTTSPQPEVPEDLRQQWEEKLAKVPEAERPAEEAAMRAELQARAELASRVLALRAAQAAEREQRRAEGKATLKDRVTGLFGW